MRAFLLGLASIRGAGFGALSLMVVTACGDGGGDAAGGDGDGVAGGAGAISSVTGGGPAATGGTGDDPRSGGGAPVGGAETGGVGTGGDGPGGSDPGGAGAGGAVTGGAVTGGVGIGGAGTGGSLVGGVGSGGAGTGGSLVGGAGTGGAGTGGAVTGGAGTGGAGTGGAGTGGVGGAAVGGGGGSGGGDTGGDGATGGSDDTVTRTASTYTFRHYPIETDANGVWNGPASPAAQVTSSTFDTVVLENGFLRVTLLPEYGGRILSIVHKPTGRELLYQNPLGTPYLMNEEIFYYDYLMILGGIFPSFPEPEHGKYWDQPYRFEVVSESPEAITVRMSRQDDRDLAAGVPTRYDVGRTDVLVELEVTLRAGTTSLELATRLTNTRSGTVPAFEYWTVTTLAPGSTPGRTAIPLDTRILAQMEQVHLLESSWSWFGSAEERVSGEIFRWNNLSHFANWVDQGTAFASPSYSASWSGLLNEDEHFGILRVTEGGGTTGLKLWTFGRDSLNVDVNDPTQWLRPTIEMWHGVTPEFWDRGSLAANEVRQWSDRYFPTLGLEEVTAASAYGALHLTSAQSGADTVLVAAASLTLPGQTVRAILRLDGVVIAEQDVVVAATDATRVSATVATSDLGPGATFGAEFLQGETSLLSGQITLP